MNCSSLSCLCFSVCMFISQYPLLRNFQGFLTIKKVNNIKSKFLDMGVKAPQKVD